MRPAKVSEKESSCANSATLDPASKCEKSRDAVGTRVFGGRYGAWWALGYVVGIRGPKWRALRVS